MDVWTIIIVGLVATGYLSLVGFFAQRGLRLTRASLTEAINSLVIPEPVRSRGLAYAVHIVNGILFTAAYAYVFNFVRPDGLSGYLQLGSLIGLVHGFLTAYFMWMGFSTPSGRGGSIEKTWPAAVLHILAHVVFGLVASFGLYSFYMQGTVLRFLAWAGTLLVALIGLTSGLSPSPRQEPTRRREGRRVVAGER